MQQVLRTMQENPAMLQQMRAAVSNMSPEQLQAAVRASLHLLNAQAMCSHSFFPLSMTLCFWVLLKKYSKGHCIFVSM